MAPKLPHHIRCTPFHPFAGMESCGPDARYAELLKNMLNNPDAVA
jgi:hypothetical protein